MFCPTSYFFLLVPVHISMEEIVNFFFILVEVEIFRTKCNRVLNAESRCGWENTDIYGILLLRRNFYLTIQSFLSQNCGTVANFIFIYLFFFMEEIRLCWVLQIPTSPSL